MAWSRAAGSLGTLRKPWPVTLREDHPDVAVVLRPLRRRDASQWLAVRSENRAWLDPWEATTPAGHQTITGFAEYVRFQNAAARAGTALPFVIEVDGALAGQLTVSSIQYGSLCGGTIGYWLSKSVAGRGVMPTAVALVVDYCFTMLDLHRIEINIRPENHASLRVVEKLGFRDEGLRARYMHIKGQWCDHRTFAICAEDVPGGLLARWQQARIARDDG